MNKNVVICLSIIAATTLICFFIYTQNNRFVTANAGNGKVYKINKRTGESVLIRGAREIPVAPSEPTKEETIEERAIDLAKRAFTLTAKKRYSRNNKNEIRLAVEKITGNLKIIGWQARQADEQTFVVTYSFDVDDKVLCWAFEVKPKEDFVRNIIGDAALEKKYGFNQPAVAPTPDPYAAFPIVRPAVKAKGPWDDYAAKPATVAPTHPNVEFLKQHGAKE